MMVQHDEPRQQQQGRYRFLNPYNFVRPLEVYNQNEAPLLGRCLPPPHDRYVGLSGSITCQITARTPLFVADSHNVTPDDQWNEHGEQDHYHYHFFRDPEGNFAIPGTSLRGMLRSVFEAVTNSCFSVFEDRRLSYHLQGGKASWLVPARVECEKARSEGEECRWFLRLLTGTSDLILKNAPDWQYAAWLLRYWPIKASKTLRVDPYSDQIRGNQQARHRIDQFQQRTQRAHKGEIDIQEMQHGEQCYALLKKYHHPHPKIHFWDVIQVSKERNGLPKDPEPDQQIVQGWICLNNQNIEAKHSERFFFRSPGNHSGPERIDLPNDVRNFYEDLIKDYQKRHAAEIQRQEIKGNPPEKPYNDSPAFSQFSINKDAANLQEGDLVYAMLDGTVDNPFVKFIVPVSVPRVGYSHTIGDLLTPPGLRKCNHYHALCPACRLFGWVSEQASVDLDKPVAYAGRVQISHAQLRQSAGSFDTTLAILSTPKPTTTRFYLAPIKGKPQNGQNDNQVSYDAPDMRLRGRKMYRHHGNKLNKNEYSPGNKSKQNRTVHNVQQPETLFECTVQFENLADVELGALLWSLELEGWHHRIGMGKPLGFGSATITISELKIMHPQQRYHSLSAEEDGWIDARERKPAWIQAFKDAMKKRYGKDFDTLDNIKDLRTLLSDSPMLPIHYPRPTCNPHADGNNYEWFVGNKRSGKHSGPYLALPMAEDDTEGLPLLDKSGKELS